MILAFVALLAEGVDRNLDVHPDAAIGAESPSSRRAWIEIPRRAAAPTGEGVALLAEGVDRNHLRVVSLPQSPQVALLAEGVDRNWFAIISFLPWWVALLAEGVDRNNPPLGVMCAAFRRPPRGGRG